MSKGWWQFFAAISLSLTAIFAGTVIYAVLAFKSNLKAISESQGVCLTNSEAFDSIAAAQMIGRLDFVSFLLTAGGILFGLFAFTGFWMIRREALDEAASVAANETRRIANAYYQNNNGTSGGDKSVPDSHIGEKPSPVPIPFNEVSTAGATEEKLEQKGARSDKSQRRPRRNTRASKNDSGSDGPIG